ncbi:MAG: GNAT family N-acetyltransferase [Alphaproteobacteria bacterium]
MPDGRDAYTARTFSRIADISAAAWDACAGGANPFVSHAFLSALEESGSATPETGWAPRHVAIEDAGGAVVAAAPMYVKSHSFGEYVFDHGWADAYERAGGRYYPKFQIAVPFTPVPGPRLLVRHEYADNGAAGEAALAAAIEELVRRYGVSGAHVTFAPEDQVERLARRGWLVRLGYQFHFENPGYGSFEDFLAALSSRKRKAVRKERAAALADGLTVRALRGPEIEERHWDTFFDFYISTGDRKWGSPYLTRAFFSALGAAMAERVVLFLAERGGRPVAGALNLVGPDALYGRYWGALEDHRFLHFELCYYRAIEFAIAHKIARVEAGAQGPHKISRGYLPRPTFSAHFLLDAALSRAVADFLARERRQVAFEMRALSESSPFRAGRPADEG